MSRTAGIGALEGGLSAAGVLVKVLTLVSAGCSATESIYSDVKQKICDKLILQYLHHFQHF